MLGVASRAGQCQTHRKPRDLFRGQTETTMATALAHKNLLDYGQDGALPRGFHSVLVQTAVMARSLHPRRSRRTIGCGG